MSPQDWIAVATGANTLIVLWALLYARAQVKATRESMEAQGRPYVIVDLDLDELPLMRIYVQNIGRTMARDVTIAFDPPLESTLDKEEEDRLADIGLFTQPIPTLAPGKRYDTLFDVGFKRANSELGNRYEVTVAYSGDPRVRRWRKDKATPFSEVQVIDLNVLWGLEYTTTSSLKDIHDQLKKIVDIIGSWSAGVSRRSGLVVRTRDELRQENEERRRAMMERQLAQQSEALKKEDEEE